VARNEKSATRSNQTRPDGVRARSDEGRRREPTDDSATHQVAGDGVGTLTTAQGIAISDDQNSLTTGERGPTLLEDFVMREKIFHFDHERIPERVVHARGFGVHGHFETYDDLSSS
jgi:catalase